MRWLAAAGILLALAGCATDDHDQCGRLGLPRLATLSEVTRVFDDVARQFCPAPCAGPDQSPNGKICAELGLSRLVLVPDFVNLNTYAPGNAGLYMGEQMRAHLSQRCQSRIYQAEFGRDLKLSGEGLVALTRDPGEVAREEFVGQDILIGTYAYNGNRLTLFVRKISGANGIISQMVSKEITFSCGAMGLKAVALP